MRRRVERPDIATFLHGQAKPGMLVAFQGSSMSPTRGPPCPEQGGLEPTYVRWRQPTHTTRKPHNARGWRAREAFLPRTRKDFHSLVEHAP